MYVVLKITKHSCTGLEIQFHLHRFSAFQNKRGEQYGAFSGNHTFWPRCTYLSGYTSVNYKECNNKKKILDLKYLLWGLVTMSPGCFHMSMTNQIFISLKTKCLHLVLKPNWKFTLHTSTQGHIHATSVKWLPWSCSFAFFLGYEDSSNISIMIRKCTTTSLHSDDTRGTSISFLFSIVFSMSCALCMGPLSVHYIVAQMGSTDFFFFAFQHDIKK